MYNVNILDAIRIYNSRKDFILFNIDKDLNISQFRLTNALSPFRHNSDQFRQIEAIKKEIKSGIKIK